MFADLHRDHNVDLRLRTRVHEFTSSGGHAGRVVAGMNVNVWDVTPAIQHLIRSATPVDQHRLTDQDSPLDELCPQEALRP